MLLEAIQHFLSPVPNHLKEMGYLRESIAIEERSKRCKTHWESHLDNCKHEILMAADQLPDESHIMILGSGGLHDVPIKQLLKRNFQISCVDIIHLPKIKKQYFHTNNIVFIEKDITGLIKPVYDGIKSGKPILSADEWVPQETPDIIISLNIMSQLALKLVNFSEQHHHNLGLDFQENVIKSHLLWLEKQKANILLISDISRDYYHSDKLMETIAAIPNHNKIGLNDPYTQWKWDIAPIGEADKEISITHNVGAWRF